jgi:flagellar biogenesis protein FliO
MRYLSKMTDRRKRTAALLIAFLVLGGSLLATTARSNAEKQQSETSKPESGYLLPGSSGLSAGTAGNATRELFFKTMFAVLLVGALGVAAVIFSKRLLPRIANLPGKEIRVLETAYLGPHKAVHLIEVANHRLLIGSTNETMTTLAHLSETWPDLPKSGKVGCRINDSTRI